MKKFTTLAVSLLLSSAVFAGTQTLHDQKNFRTDAYASKAEAYDAGFDFAETLDGMTQTELNHKLNIYANRVRNIEVDKSKVMIEEFAQERGKVLYRAVVNVDYHYTANESDND